ncbi:MAG: RHS repeat-associated core domain-containing protein, partial [Mariprofundus sp.]|nr:RHS repeat-associated core domain-containing protein [Mariprofundus sp.]
NMNARLYDPVLGRFISADSIIPSPGNMQAFNRYAYVLNNPLVYTDPTGHSWWTNFRDTVVKPIITIAVAAAVVYFTAGIGASWAVAAGATQGGVIAGVIGGAVSGAAAGFAAGATGAALYGGSGGQIWSAALKGAGSGVIMGAVAGYYGDAWSLSRVGVTSIAGGFAAKSAGGSYNQGFKISLAVSALAYGANSMRSAMIKSSQANKTGVNISGKSVGFHGDGYKIGGSRALEGQIPFTGSPGYLGGFQGTVGTFFGTSYNVGGWQDYLVEAFAGPHDYLNSFMYNANGNLAVAWQSGILGSAGDIISYANVIPASPFAVASVIPQSALAHLYGDL